MRPARAILVGPMTPPPRELRRQIESARLSIADTLIGVDRGASRCLEAGLRPDLAVGDWDSIGRAGLAKLRARGIPQLTLPQDKDRSDLFYAAGAATGAGARELHFIGVIGGRPDQELAVYYDLAQLAAGERGKVDSVSASGRDASFYFVSRQTRPWSEALKKGATVSVFAIGGEARQVRLQGFRYRLKDGVLPASSRGLSNEATGSRCQVTVGTGRLLIIVPNRGFKLPY